MAKDGHTTVTKREPDGRMKYEIKNRFTGDVQFTAVIDCHEDVPRSVKVGLAVQRGYQQDANLRGANLGGADLRGANLRGADLRDSNLRDADLLGANLRGANLRDADLLGANLRGANLGGANLWGANLRDADLLGANLRDSNLGGANLRDSNLRDSNLGGANLGGANLLDANLWGANLWGADLRDADLLGANLRDSNLWGADLLGAGGIADRVIDGGLRSDGYRFVLTRTEPGEWRVRVGCRDYTLSEAREHWGSPDYRDRGLGEEALLIIGHMQRVAEHRAWGSAKSSPASSPKATGSDKSHRGKDAPPTQ